MLVTQEGGSLLALWDRLDTKQKAYVIQAQQTAMAANIQSAELARRWTRMEHGIEMVTLNAEELPDHVNQIRGLKFSADNHLLLSASARYSGVWNVDSCRQQCQLQRDLKNTHAEVTGAESETTRFYFDPSGTQIWWLNYGSIFTWDALTGQRLTNEQQAYEKRRQITRSFPGRHAELLHMACSSDRRLVAIEQVANDDRGIWLINPASWGRLEKMDGLAQYENIYGMWFAPDGKMLVAHGAEGVHVWNLVTRQHRNITSSVKFVGVADSAKAVAFKSSKMMEFFSTATGEVYRTYEPQDKERRYGQALVSPVGSLVATAHNATVFLDDWGATAESKGAIYSHDTYVQRDGLLFGRLVASHRR